MRHLKQRFHSFWQTLFNGFDDTELWNLDRSLARLIVPRLKRFKEINRCFPEHLTFEEWNDILQAMIDAFELLSAEDYYENSSDENEEIIARGTELFGQYYTALWY